MIRGPAFDEYWKTKSKDWIPASAGMTNPKPGGASLRALPVAKVCAAGMGKRIDRFGFPDPAFSDVRYFLPLFSTAIGHRRMLFEVISS
ncbi:MAG: hypothetical protein IT467_10785 [Dokdonella sp.]|uniref:hypothetical protein n=1 Tax=Dokdonella sp. TaxID=2291710 RepID=UPI001AC2A556|nr:hypothetical protein [Dokdonella sp.]MBZ0221744.1 hypothetical protein [Dokdonella sp.]MCC7256400.1 hypothetical protein [Dokdonella sp.]CAG1772826.1 hypothetical protein BAC2_03095 [uncultured bacterium]